MKNCVIGSVGLGLVVASGASALTLPVEETFTIGSVNWQDRDQNTAAWNPAGYIETTQVVGNIFGTDTIFRGEAADGASFGAFVGDWSNATALEFDIRHNSVAQPLQFGARIATPGNFPAFASISFAPVVAGTFTTVTLSLDLNDPSVFGEPDNATAAGVINGVGNIQVFVVADQTAFGPPTGYNIEGQTVSFELDNVRLVPTPGAAAVLGVAGLAALRRRR